jgi:hypothetical protein
MNIVPSRFHPARRGCIGIAYALRATFLRLYRSIP